MLTLAEDGGPGAVRAALLAAGDTPLLVSAGGEWDVELVAARRWRDLASAWTRDLAFGEDPEYRRHLAEVVLHRALCQAEARVAA